MESFKANLFHFTTDQCDGKAEDNPAHSSGDHNCTEAGDDTEEADDIHRT